MSLLDILRNGVAIVNTVTKPLQCTVDYERYLSSDYTGGDKVYAPVVQLRALVDWKQKQVRTAEGILSVSRALVMFVDIDETVAATGGQGFGDDDKIVLPDGTTGPILDMTGFIDAGTGHPLATEIYLG